MATTEQARIAKMVQNGSYFEEAKGWYKEMYLRPIAERSWYLLAAFFMVFIFLFCVLGISSILPLHQTQQVLVPMTEIDEKVVRMNPLRPKGLTANEALRNYFLSIYVLMRESYDPQTYQMARSFVQIHTQREPLELYNATSGEGSPRSFEKVFGIGGRRVVQIEALHIVPFSQKATVRFSTELRGMGRADKTEWTATIEYVYSDLLIQGIVSEKTGMLSTKSYAPQFQVLRYDVQQNKS